MWLWRVRFSTTQSHVLYVDAKISMVNPARLWPMFAAFTTGNSTPLNLVHNAHLACERENRDVPSNCARAIEVHGLKDAQREALDHPTGSVTRQPAWVAPVHPSRYTLSQEALCVYLLGLAPVSVIHKQVGQYRHEQFPMKERADTGGPGLLEGEWHFRDLRQNAAADIGNIWFAQFAHWLKLHARDQLSANYAIWKSGAVEGGAVYTNGSFAYADYSAYLSQRPPSPRAGIVLPGTRRDFWREHLHELSKKVKGRKLVSKAYVRHTSECDWVQWGLAHFEQLQAHRNLQSRIAANSTHESYSLQWALSNFRKLKNIRQSLKEARDWF
mmetsp:Transcript_7083/g.18340  ORF Transcript_7083/g.18340 Transcript_7083/m.18340 type:complete len:328 (-) Transcript_7083:80-1063(-)